MNLNENALTITHPELAQEWSPRNKKGPEKFEKLSHYKAYWICPCCHGEYSAWITRREVGDNSCPYCSNEKLLTGFNDLATTHPEIAKDWSERNTKKASEVTKLYAYKALWQCSVCGGSFVKAVKDKQLNDCPYCNGERLLKGFNSLSKTHPELVKEWSPNNKIGPDSVMKKNKQKALWICPDCGKEYSARISDRTNNNCPYCSNANTNSSKYTIVKKGVNDLATTHPELAKEWSNKNKRTVDTVAKDMTIKGWWKCPVCFGEYSKPIKDREVNDNSCPYCRGVRVLTGYNDFASLHPELMKEWLTAENALIGVDPTKIFETSQNYTVWWQCQVCGYKYQSTVYHRVLTEKRNRNNPCPYCNGRRERRYHFFGNNKN